MTTISEMGIIPNLILGWAWMLAGVFSGAVMGLFFHKEDWMGGYGSYRRRLIRLGHISFFGLGILNVMFAFSAIVLDLRDACSMVASFGLIAGAVTMPACCFLSAWRRPLRRLFPVPVAATLIGVLGVLTGWRPQ